MSALSQMNGLGLLSVLPPGAIAGVVILALAFVLGLALPRAHPVGLAAAPGRPWSSASTG